MTPLIGDIVQSTVGKVVERLADRYIPAGLGEKEREELKAESRRIAAEEYRLAVEERRGARELAVAEQDGAPPWTRALTATHRPAWSYVTLLVFCWTVLAPFFGLPAAGISELHKEIMQTVIIFYFGGRSIEKAAAIAMKR